MWWRLQCAIIASNSHRLWCGDNSNEKQVHRRRCTCFLFGMSSPKNKEDNFYNNVENPND